MLLASIAHQKTLAQIINANMQKLGSEGKCIKMKEKKAMSLIHNTITHFSILLSSRESFILEEKKTRYMRN